ncbi:hypothetical protein [Phenylobacterium soli]|uniref:Glycosyltransferase RgtA/B/C/D-like domain-containing protein n=1 Tax=Phenylobacterium soli TaxID=2170551 RepID=A0A328ABC7_9CAUL|nr:hypothetical protein [Phenylobacterium soli]RAK51941.1 hypothetical protein DJ017_19215 [Phenylobacterium soli]
MRKFDLGFGAREAAWLVLLAGYAAVLWQNYPGHMSVDSVIELHEGRFHMRENWGPAIFPWILGVFDRVWRGTGLYLAASTLLLFGGWASMPQLRGRGSWWLVPVLAGAIALPDIMLYQGIVWHDILYANASVAGFLCLAFAGRDWNRARRPWLRLAAAVVLLSVAGLVRQNGIVVVPVAALTVGWIAWGDGWRRAFLWGLGWLLAAMATTAVLSVTALPQGPGFEKANAQGFRALATYDLMGALARDPNIPLTRIEQEAPAVAAVLRAESPNFYSPQRIDFLQDSPALIRYTIRISTTALVADWKHLILTRPGLYLSIRAQVFRWVFATPVIDVCLPAYLGVDGSPKLMKELGLKRVWGDREQRLYNYVTWFYDTPAVSHVFYAAISLAVIAFLLLRRDPADKAVIGLQLAGLAFAGTFLLVSLACDYRYLYFVDIAALSGLAYVAADPRLRRTA